MIAGIAGIGVIAGGIGIWRLSSGGMGVLPPGTEAQSQLVHRVPVTRDVVAFIVSVRGIGDLGIGEGWSQDKAEPWRENQVDCGGGTPGARVRGDVGKPFIHADRRLKLDLGAEAVRCAEGGCPGFLLGLLSGFDERRAGVGVALGEMYAQVPDGDGSAQAGGVSVSPFHRALRTMLYGGGDRAQLRLVQWHDHGGLQDASD